MISTGVSRSQDFQELRTHTATHTAAFSRPTPTNACAKTSADDSVAYVTGSGDVWCPLIAPFTVGLPTFMTEG